MQVGVVAENVKPENKERRRKVRSNKSLLRAVTKKMSSRHLLAECLTRYTKKHRRASKLNLQATVKRFLDSSEMTKA